MSHFTTIQSQITNEKILKEALQKLGFSLDASGNCRGYNGRVMPCDYVAKLPGAYDVGFKRDGSRLNMVSDWEYGDATKYIGKQGGKILQQYAKIDVMQRAVEYVERYAEENSSEIIETKEGENTIITIRNKVTKTRIYFTIKPDGTIDSKTEGYSGGTCMETEGMENSLGEIMSRSFTGEFYEGQEQPVVVVNCTTG